MLAQVASTRSALRPPTLPIASSPDVLPQINSWTTTTATATILQPSPPTFPWMDWSPQAYATDALGTSADAAAGLLLTICGRASCRESDFVGRTRGLAGDMSR